ncbi:hypothetical protein [Paramicrobacterium chengjingii]|uniref:Uncharacterized protein n=1 Tax=Paramicrobacterium chengjingii TaxID=2769067 RepID=A0ABX6YE56_9MICO|nr:hypothetical protein [Microbacterium chengjingii]QPZ37078.1 hypothetical protein HCR76_09310 [Microbacterium chengjingii]
MSQSSTTVSRSALASGVTVILIGIALAAWIGFGRVLFGWSGTIGMIMSLTIAPLGLVLHGAAGLSMRTAVRRGHSIRRAIVAFVLAAGSGVLFGATVPEITEAGARSFMAPTGEPWAVEMTVALCNPLGIVYLGMSTTTLVLSRTAVRGPRRDVEPHSELGVG